ncbi:hypothetical protein AVEN_93581-1 [Araneus ventricosus]|uniref:Uncharacterized protein n=1 Tax=Araneus ventricosus TaxID=182803 RepID=A0A4Y2APJ5_ARAVE|nr:hypothetical protein AVEN_93581-1 [Araneus ventricosus]
MFIDFLPNSFSKALCTVIWRVKPKPKLIVNEPVDVEAPPFNRKLAVAVSAAVSFFSYSHNIVYISLLQVKLNVPYFAVSFVPSPSASFAPFPAVSFVNSPASAILFLTYLYLVWHLVGVSFFVNLHLEPLLY